MIKIGSEKDLYGVKIIPASLIVITVLLLSILQLYPTLAIDNITHYEKNISSDDVFSLNKTLYIPENVSADDIGLDDAIIRSLEYPNDSIDVIDNVTLVNRTFSIFTYDFFEGKNVFNLSYYAEDENYEYAVLFNASYADNYSEGPDDEDFEKRDAAVDAGDNLVDDEKNDEESDKVDDGGKDEPSGENINVSGDDSGYKEDIISLPGADFLIEFSDTYHYNGSPVSIFGNSTIIFENESIDGNESIDENYSVNMIISPLDSERQFSCDANMTGNSTFDCELPPSAIELSSYDIDGTLNHMNATRDFNSSFELLIEKDPSFEIDTEFSNFIDFSTAQNITAKTLMDGLPLDDSDVSIKIISDNHETSLQAERSGDSYFAQYIPKESGIHSMEVKATNGMNYAEEEHQFRVMDDDVNISLDMNDTVTHNHGRLNMSGNITLTDSGDFIRENVSLYYSRESGKRYSLCTVRCNGFCDFSCPIDGILEYSTYNITAELDHDGRNYTDEQLVDIEFDQQDIDFNLSYSDQYLTEQRQNFFFQPLIDDRVLDEGSAYAEITDPSHIMYKITPDKMYDGFAFEFIGLEPGNYTINIIYLSEMGYKSESYNYTVLEDIADIEDDAMKDITNRDRKIRDILGKDVLHEFKTMVESNETGHMRLQLPFSIDENVPWLILSPERSYEISDNLNIIPETLERLRLSDYVSRGIYEKIDGSYIYYIESEPVDVETEVISDNRKEIYFTGDAEDLNYSDVTINMNLGDVASARRQNIIVTDRSDNSTISGVDYETERRGIVDSLSFTEEELSKRYSVDILVDKPAFDIEADSRMRRGTSSVVRVKYRNPDVSILDKDFECDIVVNGTTKPMISSKHDNAYVYGLEYEDSGEEEYTVLCGSDSLSKNMTVTEPRTVESFSERSSSTRRNSSSRVLMSYNKPQYYKVRGEWREIDDNFYPSRSEDSGNHSLEYVADKGIFSAYLGDLSEDYPFTYRTSGHDIDYSVRALNIYNTSSNQVLYSIEPNPDTLYRSDGNRVIYEGIFGQGTDLIFTYRNSELKQELSVDTEVFELPHVFSNISNGSDDLELHIDYGVDAGDLVIDDIETTRDISLRTKDFEDSGIYITRDYYYPEDNITQRTAMSRSIKELEESRYVLTSKMDLSDYEEAEGVLMIDPTFSIVSNDRDAMSIDNMTLLDYLSEDSQYLYFGGDGGESIYQTGLQFQLDVPFGVTINDAYVVLTAGENQTSGEMNASIHIENSSDTSSYTEGTGNISSRDYNPDKVQWELSEWNLSSSYETPDISSLIQDIVDDPGWSSGNYIGLMLRAENESLPGYRSLHGYSSPGDNLPVLVLSYESDDAAPQVFLENPGVDGFLSSSSLNFSYTPVDEDALDSCELWGDFDGEWGLNQTESDPKEGELNFFDNITLDDGQYSWNVWCSDEMGNAAFNDSNRNFTVDTSSPEISLDYPENSSSVSDIDLGFSFTPYNEISSDLSCELYYNDLESDTNDTIKNISTSSENTTDVHVQDMPVGYYEWNVSCSDQAGNTGHSERFTFTLSRDSLLNVSTEADIYSNFSLFEDVELYANYTNSSDDPITDASCNFIADTETTELFYDSEDDIYIGSSSFTEPYNNTYSVECNSTLYDTASDDGWLYIYPVINTSGNKAITATLADTYTIDLYATNHFNTTARITLNEFVPSSFDAQFSTSPDSSESHLGAFSGEVHSWTSLVPPDEKLNITYTVEAVESDFMVSELYITALESYLEG